MLQCKDKYLYLLLFFGERVQAYPRTPILSARPRCTFRDDARGSGGCWFYCACLTALVRLSASVRPSVRPSVLPSGLPTNRLKIHPLSSSDELLSLSLLLLPPFLPEFFFVRNRGNICPSDLPLAWSECHSLTDCSSSRFRRAVAT
jgi:hypothetical protein